METSQPREVDDSEIYRPAASPFRRIQSIPRRYWAGVGLAIPIGLICWLVSGGSPLHGDLKVHLHGPNVDRLNVGVPVVLGTQRVGQVIRVASLDGRLVADLQLERAYAVQLPVDSQFSVESLNDWLPGNIGVRVHLPEAKTPFAPLRDGATIQAAELVLLAEVPPRFGILVLAAIVVLIVAIVIAGLLRDWIRRAITMLVAVAIIWGAYLYFSGVISQG
jgi:hypothetical protein